MLNSFLLFLKGAKIPKFKAISLFAVVLLLVISILHQSQAKRQSNDSQTYFYTIDESKIDSLVTYAQSLEGVPYLYAGKTTEGFDCSGFIYHVYNKFGIELPAGSTNQYQEGEPIAKEEISIGDLVFFKGYEDPSDNVGHVGIVISVEEEIHFIHSSSGGGGRGITTNSLEHPQYKERYLGARRIIELEQDILGD
jgi:cell wall-associated NlpC family hydrolase